MTGLNTALTDRMNYLIARQGVVAGNIANADTPGYLSQDLTFQSVLSRTVQPVGMAATQAGHMQGQVQHPGSRVETSARFMQHNGNSVRIDQEMLKMQETQLNYRFMTQIYSKQVQLQRAALGQR